MPRNVTFREPPVIQESFRDEPFNDSVRRAAEFELDFLAELEDAAIPPRQQLHRKVKDLVVAVRHLSRGILRFSMLHSASEAAERRKNVAPGISTGLEAEKNSSAGGAIDLSESVAPPGLNSSFQHTPGSRPGLHSFAALRLCAVIHVCLLFFTSCGYHIAGKRLDAGKGLTIAVPTFANRTTAYRIEQHVSDAVRQELIRRTRFTVQPQETGDVVVTGEVKAVNLSPVIFNQQGRGSSYTVIVDFKVVITDKRTNTVIFQNDSWTFRDVFELAQSSAQYVPEDPAALDRLSRRFASALVDSMLYAK
jgi:hypothetical protein